MTPSNRRPARSRLPKQSPRPAWMNWGCEHPLDWGTSAREEEVASTDSRPDTLPYRAFDTCYLRDRWVSKVTPGRSSNAVSSAVITVLLLARAVAAISRS